MNKKLKFAFLASILLNVLLAGLLLGELPRRFDRGFPSERRMRRDLETLPEPARTRVRENMKRMRREVDPIRDQIRNARGEALRILATEPFDEAGYDRKVNEISELRVRMGKRMADDIKEIARGLPEEQRKALAETLKRPPPDRSR